LSSYFGGGYILSLFLYDEVFFPFFANERSAVQDSADGFKFSFLPDGGCNPVTFSFVIGEDNILSTFLFD